MSTGPWRIKIKMKSHAVIINDCVKRALPLFLSSYIHLLQKLECFIGISITEKNHASTPKLIVTIFQGCFR